MIEKGLMNQHTAVNYLRRAIKDVLDTMDKSEWKTDIQRKALDTMEDAYHDTAVLTVDTAAELMVADIREILWPESNPEEDWSPDTLNEIAEVLCGDGWKPPVSTPEAASASLDKTQEGETSV